MIKFKLPFQQITGLFLTIILLPIICIIVLSHFFKWIFSKEYRQQCKKEEKERNKHMEGFIQQNGIPNGPGTYYNPETGVIMQVD